MAEGVTGATIQIRRTNQLANWGRDYGIYVDGRKAGSIRNGGILILDMAPGCHEIRARIDWCWSHPISIEAAEGRQIDLEVGCKATMWHVIYLPLFMIYSALRPGGYLYLRPL